MLRRHKRIFCPVFLIYIDTEEFIFRPCSHAPPYLFITYSLHIRELQWHGNWCSAFLIWKSSNPRKWRENTRQVARQVLHRNLGQYWWLGSIVSIRQTLFDYMDNIKRCYRRESLFTSATTEVTCKQSRPLVQLSPSLCHATLRASTRA